MRGCALAVIAIVFVIAAHAQPDRIRGAIDNTPTVVISGNTSPLARAGIDQGPVQPSFPLPAMSLELKPSAMQEAALQQLLADQQNPSSPVYHHWLTPDQYADRFGLSQLDINKISAWLESQGFKVQRVGRSRTEIGFSGTAQQVENAFHTQIHQYLNDGKLHYANAGDPSIPSALAGIVAGIGGLNNYGLKPHVPGRPIHKTVSKSP